MIYFKDFKNFGDTQFDDNQRVTIVVGPNGSGKSNFIEGVELLAFLVSGRPLHEITDIGRQGGLEIRGGLEACARRGTIEFTLGYQGHVLIDNDLRHVVYQITIRVDGQPRVAAESLRIQDRDIAIFDVPRKDNHTLPTDNEVRYDNYSKGKNKPYAFIAGDRSAISQYTRFASDNKKFKQNLAIIDSVLQKLATPAVFDPIPNLMRDYQRESETQLARSGFNISPVLLNILTASSVENIINKRNDTNDVLARILGRISQLPDEPFENFQFIRTTARDVMFGFKVPGADDPVPARLLSDGTLRSLAVLTALETSASGRRIIIEEFDNGVHPSRVHLLSEALFDCSNRNDLRTVVTTHNPATLNSLDSEQLTSVLLALPDRTTGFARMLPLRDLPGSIDFIEKGRLGDLVTKRVYEKHLNDNYEEERAKSIENWLGELP